MANSVSLRDDGFFALVLADTREIHLQIGEGDADHCDWTMTFEVALELAETLIGMTNAALSDELEANRNGIYGGLGSPAEEA